MLENGALCCSYNIDPFRRCDHPSGVDGRSPRAQTCPIYLPVSALSRSVPSSRFSPLLSALLSLLPRRSLPLSLSRSTATTSVEMCSKVRHSRTRAMLFQARLMSNWRTKRRDRKVHVNLRKLKHASSHVVVSTCY